MAVNVLYSALRFAKSREEVIEEQRKGAEYIFTKIFEGPSWVRIVDEAEEGNYDVIVMGSKGKGTLESIAEKIYFLCNFLRSKFSAQRTQQKVYSLPPIFLISTARAHFSPPGIEIPHSPHCTNNVFIFSQSYGAPTL